MPSCTRIWLLQGFREDNEGVAPWLFDENFWQLSVWGRVAAVMALTWERVASATKAVVVARVGQAQVHNAGTV